MKYRAIRPISYKKVNLLPGEILPDGMPKSWISKRLKADEIAVYKVKEGKWQQEEQLAQSTQEST